MAHAKQDPLLYRLLMDPFLKQAASAAINEELHRYQQPRREGGIHNAGSRYIDTGDVLL